MQEGAWSIHISKFFCLILIQSGTFYLPMYVCLVHNLAVMGQSCKAVYDLELVRCHLCA